MKIGFISSVVRKIYVLVVVNINWYRLSMSYRSPILIQRWGICFPSFSSNICVFFYSSQPRKINKRLCLHLKISIRSASIKLLRSHDIMKVRSPLFKFLLLEQILLLFSMLVDDLPPSHIWVKLPYLLLVHCALLTQLTAILINLWILIYSSSIIYLLYPSRLSHIIIVI
jgi:hypothetical protein